MKSFTFTGCIAVGKTTLAKSFAEKNKYLFVEEDCNNNPYLEYFYKDMKAYAEQMQLHYLNSRIEQLSKIDHISHKVIVQDQMLHAFGYIFPHMQYAGGILTSSQFLNISNLLSAIQYRDRLISEECFIYIRTKPENANRLYERIIERDRSFERTITLDYLKRLIGEYEKWFKGKISNNYIDVDAFNTVEENLEIVQRLVA